MAGKHVGCAGTVLCVLVAVLTGGCGTSRPLPRATGTPTAALPTDPASIASRDALAAYDGMMADWTAVSKTSDYQDPTLTRHVSGDALSRLVRIVAAAQAAGVVSKGQPIDNARVVQLIPLNAPTEAILTDCADGTAWLQYKVDGTRVPGVGGHYRVDATADDLNGVWKITKFAVQVADKC